MTSPEFNKIVDHAASRYRPAGRFAMGFARGKLLGDPVFKHLLTQGLAGDSTRVLDLGCGQGLLAALLDAADAMYQSGHWPAEWPAPAHQARVRGIELMPRDVERARAAVGDKAEFLLGDIAQTPFPPSDLVVILDVLHYLPWDAQQQVLSRVAQALSPKGRLLLRIGDASGGIGFSVSQWVDRIVTWSRGHRLGRLYCRPLNAWISVLSDLGFEVDARPMSDGTLFANVLLTANLRAHPTT